MQLLERLFKNQQAKSILYSYNQQFKIDISVYHALLGIILSILFPRASLVTLSAMQNP